ncbi:PREDICTED: RNA-directed DNA polymerase from mobile element jockey-like [Acropora digitifera]|uniref:RNA-directed DNA polymerase from mobile element jockey-like n=1 Tax=Acropora digitifera TaxID=70779 RepID=UPI00077A7294|nr:PREDICTED: RNA-directed DNA polymerase from mobile element jockey-like [Acropora digitifera]
MAFLQTDSGALGGAIQRRVSSFISLSPGGVPWIEAIRLESYSLIFAKLLIVWTTLFLLRNSRLLVWQVICGNGSMIISPTRQGTSVNKSRSDRDPIRVEVPQGSLLEPRLFASYVNDLPDSIASGEVYMYADDTTIHVVGNTVNDITTELQAVLDRVNSWCLSNRLIVHEGKSEAMVLSTTPFVGPLKHLRWGEDTIRYVSSTNCLGVTIDDKLSWSQHITLARSAFNAKVKMLRRINFLSTSISETFYYKIVIPSVLYGIVIWGSGPKLKDLEMIHIRAARLIHKLPTSFKDSDILSKVGWMPLEYFYKFRILTSTYNAYYNLGLREINSLITKNSNSYNLRKSLNVVLNRPKTELGRRSFVHRSAIAWNALPDNLKDSSNLSTFKYNLKQSKQTIMNINFGKGGNVIHKTKPEFHYY